MSKIIKYYKRLNTGELERRHLILDDNDILIVDMVPSDNVQDKDHAAVLELFPHLVDQIANGAKFRLTEDGSLLAVFVPESEKLIYRFFTGGDVQFKGSVQLKEEFDRRISEAGGPSCPSCTRGQIMREMTPAVRAAIKASYGDPNPNTRTEEGVP